MAAFFVPRFGRMCTQGTKMKTTKVAIREFREKLADYLESGTPLAITRHGETVGFYIPAQLHDRAARIRALRAAAKQLDDLILSWNTSEEELMSDYKRLRKQSRQQKRHAE